MLVAVPEFGRVGVGMVTTPLTDRAEQVLEGVLIQPPFAEHAASYLLAVVPQAQHALNRLSESRT